MFSQHRFRETEEDKIGREAMQRYRKQTAEAGMDKDEFNDFQKALKKHNEAQKKEKHGGIDNKSSAAIARGDLEKVAKKRKTDADSMQKPMFLTKKQREQEALDRLKKKKDDKDKADRDLGRARNDFEQRERTDRRRARTDFEKDQRKMERDLSVRDKEAQREKVLIKEAYLGKKKKKKVVIPPSQKFKFSFDWEACEDTSVEHNSLYDMRHKISMQYGRGFMAGIDRREQRKNNNFYDELIKDRDSGRTDSLMHKLAKDKDRQSRDLTKRKKQELASRDWKGKKLEHMDERDWRILKEDCQIDMTTKGDPAMPHPLRNWREAGFSEDVEDVIVRNGFKNPTNTQRALIAVGKARRDYVAVVEETTGAQVAFTLNILSALQGGQPASANCMSAVIITNTSSKAEKLATMSHKMTKLLGVRTVHMSDDVDVLANGAEIVVTTVASLANAISKGVEMKECVFVVVRDAATVLASPDAKKLKTIMEGLPSELAQAKEGEDEEEGKAQRCTWVVATSSAKDVERFAKKFLTNYVSLTVGDVEATGRTVTQRVEWMEDEEASHHRLIQIISNEEAPFVVLCSSKRLCDQLCKDIGEITKATVIHSGKSEDQVYTNSGLFKDGKVDVIVMTPEMVPFVKGGKDAIKQVVNFNMAASIEKYIQRVGLTGLDGGKGVVTTFLTEKDYAVFFQFKSMLKACKQDIPKQLAQHPAAKREATKKERK